MSTGNKYHKDKLFAKIVHGAESGVVGEDEYEVLGEINLSIATTFTTSGTLTLQGRIKHSTSWQTIGTLTFDGDFDTLDISAYDYVRFNFTVAAGSTGEIAASGFYKAASSGGGASAAFTTIQTDAGTSPVAEAADTLTLTSSDASITITGNSTTDTIDLVSAGGSGDVTGPSSSVDNAIVRFDGTTGKIIQDYTSSAPTISDTGVASFADASRANSERIGAGSSVSNSSATVFGNSASGAGQESTAIGYSANGAALRGTSIGSLSYAGNSSVGIGRNGQAGSSCVTIGANASTFGKTSSISIGGNASATANNQLVLGGAITNITDVFFGRGVTSSTPEAVEISNTSASGTDVAGADLTLYASRGTGTGTGGHIIFQTAAASTTSSSLNTLTTQLEITDDGNVIMANLPTSASGLPTGALWNNSGVINIA